MVDESKLLEHVRLLMRNVHGMPWVAQDVDKALADGAQGDVLRELLVLVPDLVDALENAQDYIEHFKCRECDKPYRIVPTCADCNAVGVES
jgi:hypothetical protein